MKHRQFINSALLDDNVGKIELWGDVMDSKPCDWWTGEPLDIQCITPQDFKEAMAGVENCSTIELHLNSYGGDATVGIAIGNLLKQSGKHTVCVVEGIAASAAFTIAMSCDEVHVYPSSILMCHEVKSFMYGFYGNEDLKKIENGNTAYNNASAEVYSRKSGLSKAQCLNLMRKETWMTGADAISYSFADKLIEAENGSEEPVQLLNKTTMKINGVETDVSRLKIPDEFVEHTKNKKQLGGICMAKKDSDLKSKLLGAFSNAFDSIFKNEADDEEEEKEEDMSKLDKWLNDRIFPFEDKLTGEACYWGSLLGIAEMLKSGVSSFTDMYFFYDDILKAVAESGIKINFGRPMMCFDQSHLADLDRFSEFLELSA